MHITVDGKPLAEALKDLEIAALRLQVESLKGELRAARDDFAAAREAEHYRCSQRIKVLLGP